MRKTLVVYFSASGVTEGVAKKLVSVLGADEHEIIPQEKYTDADLDWTNKKSRSSIEMNDKGFRPAIANKVENMEQYDTIYIGFPIWWYTAPTIINTFLEQYNMDGKTVVPFATSGSSQMGKTNEDLRKSCSGAILKDGKRFSANVDERALKKWVDLIS